MRTNLLWTGKEYYSLENCLVTDSSSGKKITSCIVGLYHGVLYRVEYQIVANQLWETLSVLIKAQRGGDLIQIVLEADGKGNWLLDGKKADQFSGCIDVDIPLTPFTNTLPINRLNLSVGETTVIKALYLDILADTITSVQQQYTKISDAQYHYQNVPNDFEATITVDEDGFVVDYPQLFERTAKNVYH